MQVEYFPRKNDPLEIARGFQPDIITAFIAAYQYDFDQVYNTLWDIKADYTFSDTANINTLVGSDNADAGKVFRIIGLNENWERVTRFVGCAGTTPVNFDPLLRVESVRQVVGAAKNVGTIAVYIDGGDPGEDEDLRAFIIEGYGRTQMGVFSIPAGWEGYFNQFVGRVRRRNTTGDVSVDIWAEVRLFGGDFVREMPLVMHNEGGQQGVAADNYFKIPEKSDIRIQVVSEVQNNATIGADLSGYIAKINPLVNQFL
jgi:hypothetical protein